MKPNQIWLHVVLEEHAKHDSGVVGCFDKRIGARRGDIDGLFHKHVQATLARGNALLGMQT